MDRLFKCNAGEPFTVILDDPLGASFISKLPDSKLRSGAASPTLAPRQTAPLPASPTDKSKPNAKAVSPTATKTASSSASGDSKSPVDTRESLKTGSDMAANDSAVDPQLLIEDYERTEAQNEEFGLNDIRTEDYCADYRQEIGDGVVAGAAANGTGANSSSCTTDGSDAIKRTEEENSRFSFPSKVRKSNNNQ